MFKIGFRINGLRPSIARNFHIASRKTALRSQLPFFWVTTAAGLTATSAYLYFQSPIVKNEPNLQLVPDASQPTMELGLYMASQEEYEQQVSKHRNDKTSRKYTGWLYRIGYFMQDYIYEPVLTFTRFLKLSLIFLPVFSLYPMVYFGKTRHGSRKGAKVWYRLLRWAAEWGGASFIKLGQWAASRTDIFSKGLCDEMSMLHSNAKKHSFRHTKRILEEAFPGKELDEIFDDFPEEPVGCGAIAQVYLAKLNENFRVQGANQLVAVKVVHPNVEKTVGRDLKIMKFFANVIDCIPTMEWLSLPQEVDQFTLFMNLQMDLRIESKNLDTFREKFPNTNEIKFPTSLYSSKKVLIEERIYGLSMNTILDLKHLENKRVLKQISDKLIDSFLKMLILDNFIHADLHPGNIFVRFRLPDEGQTEKEVDKLTDELIKLDKDSLLSKLEEISEQGYHPQLCFIDAGLVTELDQKNRVNFISLFNALAQFDGYRAGELMIERSKTPETAIDEEVFKLRVEKLVGRVKERTFTLGSVSIGDLLDQMLSMVRTHHVRMEADFVSVVVAILILEGICRQLDPNIDLFARSIPILRKISFEEGKLILQNSDKMSMLKVWLTLEVRQFITASSHDVYRLVKSDGLCPNY